MKKFFSYLLLFVSLFTLSSVVVDASEYVETGDAGYRVVERLEENDLKFGVQMYEEKSETLRGGVKYDQVVDVLEVPASSEAKIITYSMLANHRWTLSSVSNIARQFEEDNPDWRVLAAVNGDFYDINAKKDFPYQPNNPLVSNGNYYTTSGTRTVGFKNDGSVNSLVGGTPTKTANMVLAVFDEDENILQEFPVHKLNTLPGEGESAVYFGIYNSNKQYVPQELSNPLNKFVVDEADLTLPNTANDFYGKGTISSFDNKLLQVGQFAIVSDDPAVIENLGIGVKIRVQYEFTGTIGEANTITGQNGKFVVGGEYSSSGLAGNLAERHPRTVVGIKSDGTIVLSVINGRNAASGRAGMYGNEMAAFMKSLGVVEAYNMDGGGSSYMVVREEGDFVVKGYPSDGRQRSVANAVLIAVPVPNLNIDINPGTNNLDFKIDVINDNGFSLDEIFIRIGSMLYPVVDGEVNFHGLVSNREYYYELLYRTKSGELDTFMNDGLVTTRKVKPEFHYLTLTEEELIYRIKIVYEDQDAASNLSRANVLINGQPDALLNGELIIFKEHLPEFIQSLGLIYEYNDNAEIYEVEIESVRYRFLNSPAAESLYEFFKIHEDVLNNIFK